jgi:hypothetical protein
MPPRRVIRKHVHYSPPVFGKQLEVFTMASKAPAAFDVAALGSCARPR